MAIRRVHKIVSNLMSAIPLQPGNAFYAHVFLMSCVFNAVLCSTTFGTPLRLEDALASAYSSNPQLEAQRAALRATDEEVAKALSGWRPSIGANGSYGWQRQSQTLLGPQAIQSIPQSEQLTVSQPLFDGRTIPNTAHAKNLVAAGRAALAVTEGTVLLNATNAYLQVLRDTQIVDAYQDDIRNLQRIAGTSGNRLRLGELTLTDASQAQARLLGSQLSLTAAEQQLATDRAAFEHVVGRPAETLAEHEAPELPGKEKALALTLLDNPTLLESRAQARAADDAVDAATGALLPTLSLQAEYGRSIDEIAPGVRENGVSVVGRLNIPLYQGGSEEAAIRQAKEQSSQALSASFETERQVRDDFAGAWAMIEASRKSFSFARAQASANDTALQGSVYEAQVGSRSILDILNADQELLQSKISTITQKETLVAAGFRVLNVMGKLTAADLKLPVTLYDPQAHFEDDSDRWFGLGN